MGFTFEVFQISLAYDHRLVSVRPDTQCLLAFGEFGFLGPCSTHVSLGFSVTGKVK